MGFLLLGPVLRGGFVAEVPVHRVQQLHGLLVCPNGVNEDGEEGEAEEEDESLRQRNVNAHFSPVAPAHPPHVVGQHHPAVEHVDHEPLVSLPEQGPSPTSLQEGQMREDRKADAQYISVTSNYFAISIPFYCILSALH